MVDDIRVGAAPASESFKRVEAWPIAVMASQEISRNPSLRVTRGLSVDGVSALAWLPMHYSENGFNDNPRVCCLPGGCFGLGIYDLAALIAQFLFSSCLEPGRSRLLAHRNLFRMRQRCIVHFSFEQGEFGAFLGNSFPVHLWPHALPSSWRTSCLILIEFGGTSSELVARLLAPPFTTVCCALACLCEEGIFA